LTALDAYIHHIIGATRLFPADNDMTDQNPNTRVALVIPVVN